MAEAGVDAFLVPRADAHQGENVAPRDERLAWLTSFTGSAGLAVVTRDRAAIFVDGRYRLQVRNEVDLDRFDVLRHPEDKPADWLVEALPGGGRVGFDPWLHTAKDVETLTEALGPRQIGLARVANLVDRAWPDQPPPPARPIVPHPVELAGRTSAEKRAELARGLAARDLAAAVLTLPNSIAWLLNVRGSDIARTPVPLAFAILGADARVALFTEPAKLDDRARAHLGPEVTVAPPEAFGAGARRAARPGGGRPGDARRSGSPTGCRRPAPRWSGSATPASCRRRRRTRPSSPASARRTCATARRWRPSSPGSTRPRPRAA